MHSSVCCRPTFLGEAEACCAGVDAPAACFGEDTAALDLESTYSVYKHVFVCSITMMRWEQNTICVYDHVYWYKRCQL